MSATRPDMRPECEAVSPRYEADFYSWTIAQAAALRDGRWRDLDLTHLIEEIEDLGKGEFRELASACRVILIHMLKWDHQPERRSRSWVTSIRSQRLAVTDVIDENPGLKSRRNEAIALAYRRARIIAAGETDLPERAFPAICPYTLHDVMDRPFEWPETSVAE